MPNLHPLIVHFPVALIFVVVACDVIGLAFKREKFLSAATLMTIFLLAGTVAAVITGLIAEEAAESIPSVHDLLETHETLGLTFLGVVAVMAIVRFAVHRKLAGRIGWLALALGIIAAGIVSAGAYLGSEMVFTHGVGVKSEAGIGAGDTLQFEEEYKHH